MFTMDPTVVYAVIGDTIFIRVIHVSCTGLTKLVVLGMVCTMGSMTRVPGSGVELLTVSVTAYTLLLEVLEMSS